MKLFKIYTLLLVASLFAGCSEDDEKFNTGNATVKLEQSEMKVKETDGLFSVPILISGERNGAIQVTVKVSETGINPAKEDVNYVVTTKTIIIPENKESGNIEIHAIDDDVINEIRTFTLEIVDAKGATLADTKAITISLRDNDANYYEKFAGKWKLKGNDIGDNGEEIPMTFDATISLYGEVHPNYEKLMNITIQYQGVNLSFILKYYYDKDTKKGYLSIPLGEHMGSANFGPSLGVCDILNGSSDENGRVVLDGELDGTWSEDFKTVNFAAGAWFYGFVFSGDKFAGSWFGMENVVLIR